MVAGIGLIIVGVLLTVPAIIGDPGTTIPGFSLMGSGMIASLGLGLLLKHPWIAVCIGTVLTQLSYWYWILETSVFG
jgi:hypothetical protein